MGETCQVCTEKQNPEPIQGVEKDRAIDLIGKPVLFASCKEGLGSYGTLIGWNASGRFVVEPDYAPGRFVLCSWIVEYKINTQQQL